MRAVVVAQATWLAAVLAEAPGTHTCPVHESHSAGHAAATTAPASHAEHIHHPDGEPGEDAGGTHTGCSCLGDCGTTSPVLPITTAIAGTGNPVAQARPPGRLVSDAPRVPLHPRLPFANGPPPVAS